MHISVTAMIADSAVTALSVDRSLLSSDCAHRCHTNVNIADFTALSVDSTVTTLPVPRL